MTQTKFFNSKFFFLCKAGSMFLGILYVIISPLISSGIDCFSGEGCFGVLESTGGLLLASDQIIKENIIKITEVAPTNPQYDDTVISTLRAEAIASLGILIIWFIIFFLMWKNIFGKFTSNALTYIGAIVLAITSILLLEILYTVIYNAVANHSFVLIDKVKGVPGEGVILMIKNLGAIFSNSTTLPSTNIVNMTNATIG